MNASSVAGCIPALILAASTQVDASDYYVAPGGSDAAPGTVEAPFGTLQHGQDIAQPGDTIWIRGGTYLFDDPATQGARYLTAGEPDPGPGINNVGVLFTTSGTEGQPIRYLAFPGETPVFDFFSFQPVARIRGFSVQASHLEFKGIEIRGVQQIVTDVNESWGLRNEGPGNPSFNRYELLDTHHNEGPGLFIKNGGDNLVINCDSHHNWDPDRGGENADGFGSHSDMDGNRFVGTRAWENSDDGYDCINSPGQVTFENCWAWRNGWIPGTNTAAGNGGGFKAGGGNFSGPPRHAVIGCVAWANRVWGFNANGHNNGIDWINNTSFGNPRGFDFFNDTSVDHYMRNNVSFGNASDVFRIVQSAVNDENNTWNTGFGATDGDFISLAPVSVDAPRGGGGELPALDFMHLVPTSPLVDAGQLVGRPYHGLAPDLGAFESSTSVLPGVRVINAATANTASGNASSLSLPSFQVGNGNALVVVVNSEGAPASYSVSYQVSGQPGIALTERIFDAEGSQGAGIYWLIDPSLSGSSGDVEVTFGGSSSAAVSVLSLGQVLGVSSTVTAKGTTNADLLLGYDGVAGGLVVAGGVDNAFSGTSPSLHGPNIVTPLQTLATNYNGGSAGMAQGYGKIQTTGSGIAEVFDPAGTGSSSRNAAALVAFTTSVPSRYDAWTLGFDWGSADPSPLADANADGVSNLLCYRLGLHPLAMLRPGDLPTCDIDDSTAGGPWFVYEFRENVLADDLISAIETSSDLSPDGWTESVPDGVNVISEIANPDEDGDGKVVLRRIRMLMAGEAGFLRLRAELAAAP